MGGASSRAAGAPAKRIPLTKVVEKGKPSTVPLTPTAQTGARLLDPDVVCTHMHEFSVPCAGAAIHQKDPSLVDRVDTLPEVDREPADVGQQQFQLFQTMQAVSVALYVGCQFPHPA